MPWIVDYPLVLEQMQSQNMRSLYHNSGAFGFPEGAAVDSVGWVGPQDPTLRPEARPLALSIAAPYEQNLTANIVRAWQHSLAGRVWIMPRSHWAYELDFGSRDWLPALLEHVGVDAGMLQARNNASAIEFEAAEVEGFSHLVHGLLRMLLGSDFALIFPGRPVTCTLHHHKQVWWTSTDPGVTSALRDIAKNVSG